MANIRTTFTLVDNMSTALVKINNNLNNTVALLGQASSQANGGIGGGGFGGGGGGWNFNALIDGLNNVHAAARKVSLGFVAALYAVRRFTQGAINAVNELTDVYADQYENEVKLYTIMRQRMGATLEEFNSIKALASDIEKKGVLSDKVVLKGAQELASFVQTEEQIKTLLPAIADLTVQQNGYNASANQMRQITTSIGKMLNGTVSGLSKLGLAFTDEEKKMLKSNDMAKKVNLVYTKIVEKVGDMNKAMGKTNIGKIQNLKNQLESVNEELGRMLQPMKIAGLQLKLSFETKVLEKLSKGLQWVRTNVDSVTNAIVLMTRALTIAGVVALGFFAAAHPYLTLILATIWAITKAMEKLGFGSFQTSFAKGVKEFIMTATEGFQQNLPEVPVKNGAVVVHDDELINIADDYRELLSKRAVEKFNLQLARVSPSITIEKVDVHKEADADNVLDNVVKAIEDFSNSSLSLRGGGLMYGS